jgi:hypothetical protein
MTEALFSIVPGITLATGVFVRLAGALLRFFIALGKLPSIRTALSVRERYHVFFEVFIGVSPSGNALAGAVGICK